MFDDSLLDDPEALASAEPALREIAGWGAEVRRAAVAAANALQDLDPADRPRAVVAGGADGRLFRAVLEPVCPVPFVAWPHVGLPGWAGPLDLIVLVSTRGSDQESMAIAAEAVRRGSRLLVACPPQSPVAEVAAGRGSTVIPAGSTDPLALSVPVLEALHLLGLGPEVESEPVAAALDTVAVECGPSREVGDNPAKELALGLGDMTPLVWGASVLAARAGRRIAEALRAATGRPALAGDADQLLPVLAEAPQADIFADPFADDVAVARPVLVILDDGSDSPSIREARGALQAAADGIGVRIVRVIATDGPDIGRFASLQAQGRFAAIYLALGLGRTPEWRS